MILSRLFRRFGFTGLLGYFAWRNRAQIRGYLNNNNINFDRVRGYLNNNNINLGRVRGYLSRLGVNLPSGSQSSGSSGSSESENKAA